MALVLASASARRRELLGLITPNFVVDAAQCDESLPDDLSNADAVMLLARRKARAVFSRRPSDIVVGADTLVCADGQILAKPADAEDARRMLRLLSGRTHQVCTGVCVLSPAGENTFFSEASVTFFPMSEDEIAFYAASGEPDDKAGAYAIQGLGARYIQSVAGDYYAVVGLPVSRVYQALRALGNFG
jgi:septum formation protein